MRGEAGVCPVAETRERGTVSCYEVQHSFLECERAEQPGEDDGE